jgi:signal peptidase I
MTDQLQDRLREELHAVLDAPVLDRDWADIAVLRGERAERRRLVGAFGGTVVVLGGVVTAAVLGLGGPAHRPLARVAVGTSSSPAQAQAVAAALASAPTGSVVLPVVGSAMANTLQPGDQVLVTPASGPLHRGDIVAFDLARAGHNWSHISNQTMSGTDVHVFFSRVIGVGGDVVACPPISTARPTDCDTVTVNGTPLDESTYTYATASDGTTVVTAAHPTHRFDAVTVAAGQLFVLGDHRDDANDSRYNGTIATTSVTGVVTAIVWPPAHAGPVRAAGPTTPDATVPASTEAHLLAQLPAGLLPADATVGPSGINRYCDAELPLGHTPLITDDVCFPTQAAALAWGSSPQHLQYETYRKQHPPGL